MTRLVMALVAALVILCGAAHAAHTTKRTHARAWTSAYHRYSWSWRHYASATIRCEGGIPWDRDGSGFIFRAEWSPRTWLSAGGSLRRVPSFAEEAVRVIRWTQRVGFHTTAGWPNCP